MNELDRQLKALCATGHPVTLVVGGGDEAGGLRPYACANATVRWLPASYEGLAGVELTRALRRFKLAAIASAASAAPVVYLDNDAEFVGDTHKFFAAFDDMAAQNRSIGLVEANTCARRRRPLPLPPRRASRRRSAGPADAYEQPHSRRRAQLVLRTQWRRRLPGARGRGPDRRMDR
mmetsp:Transcript_23258/g.69660  ORF Transcript_23258/g.69660 Transcript_23258/m.69660 type:complete len:177 (-) Transcript_23258:68-598(-)